MQAMFGECNAYCIFNDNNNDNSSNCDAFNNKVNKKTKIKMTMMIGTETTTIIIIIK